MKYDGTDKYCYDAHPDVLINKFGIADEELLDHRIIKEQMRVIDNIKIHSPYSLNTLCDIHRKMFSCAFNWAGKLRDIDISKGNTRFCHNIYLDKEGEKIFVNVNKLHKDLLMMPDNKKKTDNPDLVKKMDELGKIICDLNFLHPFREGNGRTLRLFVELFLFNLGIIISWPELPTCWMKASIDDQGESMKGLFLLKSSK
ncbi:Fic family protein [Xenorhabdus nematophila]|uniref:Fic/DOC family protein n=1 Tax=Xenorhabdus nematophila TaxID=628 RepID=UPI0005423EF3|nr:Fic family protein [Xenorhabdus nematophila]CEF31653.1 putative cell filamentation protein, induced in stationary phase [Xenorhabdus nematophila str. Websteri]AYA41415.1 cell filamentation protein [Xenorhabdus nematophila]KHD29743.1 cell filamentation protein [Xenorhabdus nematophila]MBA0020153.1 Fic family protein [Xenorhabdus nematophila]MCB4423732.1 cell filamentation protein [Xenorhabdus nematophila]